MKLVGLRYWRPSQRCSVFYHLIYYIHEIKLWINMTKKKYLYQKKYLFSISYLTRLHGSVRSIFIVGFFNYLLNTKWDRKIAFLQ